MAAQQIGIVTQVVGQVVAVGKDGVERVLVVGDVVYADEVIRTADAGAVTIQFNDGGWFDLGRNAQAVLDSDVYSPEGHEAEAAVATAKVEDIQAAIAAGGDPTQLLPPTAAGAAAGGGAGGEGGHSFVALDHDFVSINPEAGIPTAAEPLLFSGVERIIVPVEPEPAPPAIAVSVNVDVQVGGEPGPGGIVLIPGGTPISGGVSGANVIEGSDGSSHQVTFLITLSQVASTPVTVTYTIVPGTATNPDDYFDGSQTGTVTIPAGFIGFTVTENIVADILVEGNETFQIVLSNPVGATLTNDTAMVTIIDDDMNPVANDDTNWVQEDNYSGESESVTASGNVLFTIAHPGDPSAVLNFADAKDVDDNPLILTWGSETPAHGTITQNSDGSYVYELNNSDPVVQGLSAGETLTETFTYSITDGVNTPDTGTLTITIFGADDGVSITGIGNLAGDQTVFENDLAAGSSPNAAALTQTGSFDIVALDGIATMNVGGTLLTLAQLQNLGTTPAVIDTAYGALTLTAYTGNSQGGTVSYSYTLDTTVDNDSQAGATGAGFVESVGVTVTDEDGSVASSSVNINIIDDVPTAANDGTIIVPEDTAVTFNVFGNDTFGADGVDTDNNPTTVVTFTNATNGTVSYDAGTGLFTYTPTSGYAGSDSFTYTIKDGDADPSTATVTLQVLEDSIPQVGETTNLVVDEDGFAFANVDGSRPGETSSTASLTQSGTVVVNFGADVPVDLLASIVLLDTGLDGQLQTLDGTSVTFALVGDKLVGTAGDTPVITIEITGASASGSNVTYTYQATLEQPIKQPVGSGENTDLLSGVTFEVTDQDGSKAQGTFDVTVVDDVPVATATELTGTVDEDGLPGGIAGGIGDVAGTATVASGSVATLFNAGADAPLSYGLAGNTVTTLTALGLSSGGVALSYTVLGDTVTAKAGTTTVFTFQLTAGGSYTFTLVSHLDHAPGNNENDLTLNLSGLITATDADGDTVSAGASGLIITVDDDTPTAFVADPGAVLDTNISPTVFALNLAMGADGPGTAVFDIGKNGVSTLNDGIAAKDTAGHLLTLDGHQIYLFGDSTGTLIGTTSATNDPSGTIAFTITLNAGTNTYAVDLNGTISNGTEFITVSDLTSKAGIFSVAAIGADTLTNNLLNVDFLLIGRSSDGTTGSVNTDSDSIGVDNQSVNSGEALRIDFVSNATTDALKPSGFAYASHVMATSFRQDIPTVQGPGDGKVTIVVTAIAANDDQIFPTTLAGAVANSETKVNITGVSIFDALGHDVTATFHDGNQANGEWIIDNGVAIISGLQAGYEYEIHTTSGFSAVLTESDINNTEFFDLGAFTIGTATAQTPINLAYDVVATDADGDSATGTLAVALLPNTADTTIDITSAQLLNGDGDGNSLAGLAGNDTLNGNGGNDFLFGGAGDDILVGGTGSDVLYGQTGSDTLTGGIGGPDATSDRFVFQRGDVGHGVDTITDFTVGTQASGGDVLDISDLLAGAGITSAQFVGHESDYLVVTTAGANTTIAFDANGGSHTDAVQIATLANVNTTLGTLIGNGQVDHTV